MHPISLIPVSSAIPPLSIQEFKSGDGLSGSALPDTRTLLDVLSRAAYEYPNHELGFIACSTLGSSIQTTTFTKFNQHALSLAKALRSWGKPVGSVIVIYLAEHEDNMTAVWASLLAGYVPCLQPALSAQQAHKEGHVAHVKSLFSSATWLTNENGADQLRSIPGLDIHLLSDLRAFSGNLDTDFVVHQPEPDDDAILFLTSGSTGFSKAVVHTHRTIIAACHAKGHSYGLTSQSKVINWVGFDHVAGSLEMHIAPLLYGASQLHVHVSAILADSLLYVRVIEEKSIEVAFAPNFLLAKLTRDLEKRSDLFGRFDLASLRRVNSGGEAVVSSTAVAFHRVLKNLAKNGDVPIVISAGFGMTETCAGCIYDPIDILETPPAYEFLELGKPILGCEMRIVDPEDGVTPRPDGQSGELQVRGPMVFVRYYNDPEATASNFVDGRWYRTGDVGIIENGKMRLSGRMKDTIIVHGVSYGIPELETHLQAVEGVVHSFLAAAPYRAPGQDTEGFVVFFSPSFDLDAEDAPAKLFSTNRALQDVSVEMVTLRPHMIIPIPVDKMEKTTLGKLSRARLLNQFELGAFTDLMARAAELLSIARGTSFITPTTATEKTLARIYADIFNVNMSDISASDNFFEFGGTSIDLIRMKSEAEATFELPEIPTIQILKRPVLSSLAKYVDSLFSKDASTEKYDPIVPLNLSGGKTPIFMVHPGIGEVLIFVNLAKYFQNERPFYAFRARGFEPGYPPFGSMEEMVSCYVTAIKRTQPYGPYAIAGYSYGGVVAFELSKRLEAMGDEVKFTGLINIPPHISKAMQKIDWTVGLLNFAYFVDLISSQDAVNLAPALRPLMREAQLDAVWKMSPPDRLAELQLTIDKLDHGVDIAISLIDCGKTYEPSGSVSAVDVFYAIPLYGIKEDWFNEELKPWACFSREEPTYIEVAGSHSSLMDLDHVLGFQRSFRGCLAARGL